MASLGRWNAVDPLAEKTTSWSPYNYVMNTPFKAIDPDGRSCVGCMSDSGNYSGDPEQGFSSNANGEGGGDDPAYDGGTLPTVTFTASRTGNYDQTPVSDYNGDYSSWKDTYGYEDWAYNNAYSYWNHFYKKSSNSHFGQSPLGSYAESVSVIATTAMYIPFGVVGMGGGNSRLVSARNFVRIGSGIKNGANAAKSSNSFVKLSSKIGRSRAGNRTFSFQTRFPKSNLNVRLDRGFRSPLKRTSKILYFGKPYNGFNTHINIQKPGSFN